MTKWEEWEIEALKAYKTQGTPISDICRLLNKTESDIEEMMKEIAK